MRKTISRDDFGKTVFFQMCAMVADVSGKSVLVTRYFRAIRPPQQVMDKNENTSESVAWFVSLIPYLPRNALFPGLQVSQNK